MGTHPSNPSRDVTTGRTLLDLVQDNQALLSPSVIETFGPQLPFLLKVLSIHKALSIQAHPNKSLAHILHQRDPKNYPDDNHKPEMAVALTEFEALCGFRPLAEIAHFLGTLQPLRDLVGEAAAEEFETAVAGFPGPEPTDASRAALRKLFTELMTSSQDKVATQAAKLVEAARTQGADFAAGTDSSPAPSGQEKLAEVVERLNSQFPSDIGLFVLLFLNLVTLQPGESLFLRADDVHAYISGDIIECMASSDNVVRAGLTPKFKDVTTLVDMLTYGHAPIEEQKLTPVDYAYVALDRNAYSGGTEVSLYDPPIDEFSVVRAVLRGSPSADGRAKVTFDPLDGPSVVICTAGKGSVAVGETRRELRAGWVYFVGATAELVVEKDAATEGGQDAGQEGGEEELVFFRAFCEVE